MIKYNLKCKNKHEFESWFSDSKEFEKLLKKKLIECLFCKSKSVKKSIMSPRISHTKKIDFPHKEINRMKKDLAKLRKFVEKNFEYVGENFPREVRKIYYDKKRNKNIYGITTPKEARELKEEGIDVASIPWVNNKEN